MIRTLGKQITEFKAVSILTPLCMIMEVVMETLIPLMMASIIDKGVAIGDMGHIGKMGLLMVLVAAVSLVFGTLGGVFGAKASTGFARNLRKAMYENIQTFSFSNIDKYSTSSLVTRLTTDVTNLQNAYQMILRMCTRAPASLIFAMIMAFSINAKLSRVYLIAIIFLSICLCLIMKFAMKYFKQVFKKYDELNESVQENVSAIREVKAYVREDYEGSKFQNATTNIAKMFMKAENVVIINSPLMQMTVYACILSISWLGAKMIVGGTLTTGQMMSLLTYCMNILMSLMMLSMIFVMVSMSMASAQRIAEILEEKPDITNPEDPVTDVKNGDIEFSNVTFRYYADSEKPVLDHINLNIHAGETIGIIGGTGSAKSSLVNMISRLYDVTEGVVKVGNRDVREYDLETLRNQVAVVLQKNILFSGSIYDNLRWGNKNASDEECQKACALACADEFIDTFPNKYETHIEQGGNNVSGGQKQRICIARALLKNPKVLILDDSTSAVDTATDAKIRSSLMEHIPGTTKLIIAQRIASVQNADRIIVMEDGKINGFDSHEELLKNNEIYREVYESQTEGFGDFDENGGVQ